MGLAAVELQLLADDLIAGLSAGSDLKAGGQKNSGDESVRDKLAHDPFPLVYVLTALRAAFSLRLRQAPAICHRTAA